MNPRYSHDLNFGGSKAQLLLTAIKNGGIVKVSFDGSLIWVFTSRPKTIISDGVTMDAEEFLNKAARALNIAPDDVFELSDNQIRDIARKLTGITQATRDAAGVSDEKK